MRDALTDLVHLFFTLPFYTVVALAFAAVRAFRRGPSAPGFRFRYLFTVLALLIFVFSIPIVPNEILKTVEDETRPPGPADLQRLAARGDSQILVLSGGWFRRTTSGYEVEMGSNSWERTWSAVRLWTQIGGTLIFTGAPLPDGSDSVADRMANVARQLGVPADRVRVERRSLNTHENLEFSKKAFALGADDRPVVLVSSALHMPRSVAIADRLGLRVVPYPCDYRAERLLHWRMWLPGNDGPGNFEEALHELVGLLFYRLRGWA